MFKSMSPKPKLTFKGKTYAVEPGTTILRALTQHGVDLRSDCEFGYCGTDAIVIVRGMENLSVPIGDEVGNLEFNKFPMNVRMACVTRIFGDVEIDLFN